MAQRLSARWAILKHVDADAGCPSSQMIRKTIMSVAKPLSYPKLWHQLRTAQ